MRNVVDWSVLSAALPSRRGQRIYHPSAQMPLKTNVVLKYCGRKLLHTLYFQESTLNEKGGVRAVWKNSS